MPSLKATEKTGYPAEKSLKDISTTKNDGDSPPPLYTTTDSAPPFPPPDAAAEIDINSAFRALNINSTPLAFPNADLCLAHLKLLSAFNALKEEIGFAEGLFGIKDPTEKQGGDLVKALGALREKRWNLYVAKAVERFQEWWLKVLCTWEEGERMTCGEAGLVAQKFVDFTNGTKLHSWTTAMLPPLDVLMVWHSFMLNPRKYLEDCAKFGLKALWATGMPWQAINEAIDTEFNYNVPDAAVAAFINSTGHQWDCAEDGLTKALRCPRCSHVNQIPWTTCTGDAIDFNEMKGSGYGDQDFLHSCTSCGKMINHELLQVSKFKKDTENLILHQWPMPGSILTVTGGLQPDSTLSGLVNRLVKTALRIDVLEIFEKHEAPTMNTIKGFIEKAISTRSTMRKVNESAPGKISSHISFHERSAIRKMMSRYWDNSSVFSLELGGAVIRQGSFVGKMQKLDWLHSPAAAHTMKRLLVKYGRFIDLMALSPRKTLVPTLDVDLGWHTHQLAPKDYFDYTVRKCQKFIDHDDKISEDKITEYFEATSALYQTVYGEVYSECTCWYCEAIRIRHIGSTFFGSSKNEKPIDDFYRSGAADLCPPDKSAHISTHNVVRICETGARKAVFDRLRVAQESALQTSYLKACTRADKKGRKRPERKDEYYYYWGYPYAMMPWYPPPVMVGGYYYTDNTTSMPQGMGMTGACAAGTCAGGAASGACAPGGGDGGGCGGGCSGGGGCGGGGGGCGGGGGS